MELTKHLSASQLAEALKADHVALESTFEHVLTTMQGGDPESVRAAWLGMESDLLAHLKVEEELILPGFEKAFPKEAGFIREDHVAIRAALEQLGVDLDLHTLRKETADLFIEKLRKHAEREDHAFYRWAEEHLSEATRQSVFGRLRGILRVSGGEPPKH